jgi:hypothetical protein
MDFGNYFSDRSFACAEGDLADLIASSALKLAAYAAACGLAALGAWRPSSLPAPASCACACSSESLSMDTWTCRHQMLPHPRRPKQVRSLIADAPTNESASRLRGWGSANPRNSLGRDLYGPPRASQDRNRNVPNAVGCIKADTFGHCAQSDGGLREVIVNKHCRVSGSVRKDCELAKQKFGAS